MTNRINVAAFPGADNIESFTVQNEGIDYDLDVNGVTRVDAYVCCKLAALASESDRVISSDDADTPITFSGSTLNIKFGAFGVGAGVYKPKIKIFNSTSPDGLVIAGSGLEQEIQMTMSC